MKKAEKDLNLMNLEVSQVQVEVLEAEVRKTKETLMEVAESMTALVDKVWGETQVFFGEGSEVSGKVREEQTIQLTSELQRAEEAYKQNSLLDTVLEEIILVEGELGQGGEGLTGVKELLDTLKAEAKDLMEKLHMLNSMKNDGGDSAAVGQVRELQLEISELELEVRGPPLFLVFLFVTPTNIKVRGASSSWGFSLSLT